MLLPALRERRGERGQLARLRQARAHELGAHLRFFGRNFAAFAAPVRDGASGFGARGGHTSRRSPKRAGREGWRTVPAALESATGANAGSRSRPGRGRRSRARSEARARYLSRGKAPGDRGDPSREPRRGGGPSRRGSREHPASHARTRRVRAVRDERGAIRCGRPSANRRGRLPSVTRFDDIFFLRKSRKGERANSTHNLAVPSPLERPPTAT